MIFQSAIMALLLSSLLDSLILVWAALFAVSLLKHWDAASGHGRQITLERRTYLVSTALVFVMLVELMSLILFVYNADRMAVMFVGAMCAVGTLNVNAYGFPALLFKLAAFFGSFVWLVLHHVDGKGRDYPFMRFKYWFLIGLAPVMVFGAVLQLVYFLYLEADVITSCCSRIFTPEVSGIEAQLASLDPKLALWVLFAGLGVLSLLASVSFIRIRLSWLYALFCPVYFVGAITAIISVIAPYIYAQPHHHCPFCILKPEYDFIGYGLYLCLFVGTAFGLSAGALSLPIKAVKAASLKQHLPRVLYACISLSIGGFLAFGGLCLFAIWSSQLVYFR
ncbi:hypothetical protein [Cohaesibacter celericrescens]|uniref:Uncharacterized protein n=1 Tax=Cohaesibacter celericrescens TaxID=2067669 RepID=A0A2N5XTJ2_9HYPH|nr:hypothetical protein [Cohaesibacter celericrescens]PLW77823.1 hypothetical protein C0081_07475 [Cohaesibacter celericrescens]